MSDQPDDDGNEFSNFDELVGDVPVQPDNSSVGEKSRIINLILDPSVFTRGIGNIKRWYNEEYIRSRIPQGNSSHTTVNLYIPSFTLHEFDYLKKGTSMTATYTRQSIRFIDDKFEKNETTQDILPNFQVNLLIEGPGEKGPRWQKCQRYQKYSPRIKDFPYFKTKFDSTFLGKKYEDASDLPSDIHNDKSIIQDTSNDIQYENSRSYMNAAANSEKLASMPARLKYLISSCIFKKFIQPHQVNDILEEWRLVSEEPITQIWARSFGIDSMNVNEAELLMFQSFDANKLYNPHTSFTLDDDKKHDNILQDTVDTSVYRYEALGTPYKPRRKHRRPAKQNHDRKDTLSPNNREVDGVTNEVVSQINGEVIKKERFDSINYAPRSQGQLWKPNRKTKSKPV